MEYEWGVASPFNVTFARNEEKARAFKAMMEKAWPDLEYHVVRRPKADWEIVE